MKMLGMVGGLGPESTIEYYKTIVELYRQRRGDGHYPGFLINSVDLQKGTDWFTANDLRGVTDYLVEQIEKLARAGATFGLISANTPHLVFDEVGARVSIPLISIVETAVQAVKR